MPCKACGSDSIGKVLGKCPRCTLVAGISSLLFWLLYHLTTILAMPAFVRMAVAAFAMLVSLLFIGHLAGHLAGRRKPE